MKELDVQGTLIFACWPASDPLLAGLDGEPALLEMAGKSTLQRSVEQAVALGARRLDVILGENAAPYEQCLGDGERWGCEITYHYARSGPRPLAALAKLLEPDAEYLVLQADRNLPPGHEPRPGRLGCWLDRGELRWSGWGRLPGWVLADCLAQADSRESMERTLLADPRVWCEATEPPSRADSAAGLLMSLRRLLRCPEQPVGITRNPVAPGLWIGNGCRIHPTAVVTAPAYLGDHVLVGAGAVVGPNAAIGARSIIDRNATVIDGIVAPESYLGAGVEMRQSLLAGRSLVNVALGACVEVPDRELAGPASRSRDATAPGIAERLVAAGLWAALLPLRLLATACAGGPATQPAQDAVFQGIPGAWLRHFRECFHPGLGGVVRGRLRIVGPLARSPEQVAALPESWRKLHRLAAPGLVNEALLLGPEGADPAIGYAGDALSTKKLQTRHILAAVRRYIAAVMTDWRARRVKDAQGPGGRTLAASAAGDGH